MGFSGLSQVTQGLFASQEAIRITGENVQNASTKGYARRVATFASVAPTGHIGVNVSGVVMRDSYLDSKVWIENGITTEWSTKANYYDRLMGIVDEPSDYSITQVTNDFFSSFQKLANEPSNTSYRIATVTAAEQFTNLLNNTAAQLETLQTELNEDVYTNVQAVNSLIDEIAELSISVYNTEIAGRDASYTRDALQNKIAELSEYGNVTVTQKSHGKLINGADDMRMTISFGGMVVVNHGNTTKLACVKRETKNNIEDIEGLYDVEMETGSQLDLTSGKLKALLDIRDGDGENNTSWVKGVVYYMREMNNFASTFAKAFNEGMVDNNGDGEISDDEKVKGYADAFTFNSIDNPIKDPVTGDPLLDADGKMQYEPAGLRFFTIDNMKSEEFVGTAEETDKANNTHKNVSDLYKNVTAKNISISADILNDIENMACSFTDPEYENDVQAILDLIGFRENTDMFGTGDGDGFLEGMIASVGLDAQKSISLSEMHSTLLDQAKQNQSSYSDVAIDEETTYAVQFQQMYKACANLINVYSELYDSLLMAV